MPENPAVDIWVYLSATPLLGLTITLVAYLAADWVYRKAGSNPLLNPVAVAVVALIVLLNVTGTPYDAYFEGAQFVHFLLGPATVALAIPLYEQLRKLRALFLPISIALLAGLSVGALSAVGIAALLGASSGL